MNSSKPRNRLIAQLFYDMGMIEQYGSGTGRVIKACKAAGLPEPEFNNFSGGFRILFIKLAGGPESGPESRLESRLESKLAASVLLKLREEAAGKSALANHLGHKTVSGELHKQIRSLLDKGLIEMTLPEKPNSRLQKYRLTEKGRALVSPPND